MWRNWSRRKCWLISLGVGLAFAAVVAAVALYCCLHIPRLPLPAGVSKRTEQLALTDPRTEYANLAIRGRKLREVVEEQIEPAVAMAPTQDTLQDFMQFVPRYFVHQRYKEAVIKNAIAAISATRTMSKNHHHWARKRLDLMRSWVVAGSSNPWML